MVSCTTKETLYTLWKNNPTSERLKKEYTNYTKILNKVIKEAKFKYEKDIVKRNSGNSKELWNIIKTKLGKNSAQDSAIKYIYENNQKIENKTDIPNAMNTYFCEIGPNLSARIANISNNNLELPDRNPKSIFFRPTNFSEIYKIINTMKNKSGGVDNINAKTLKILSEYISVPLEYIFNLCIAESIWSDALKNSEVPIYKTREKSHISNYRPISLISNIAKIFEKIIYNRLYQFLEKHNIISEYQKNSRVSLRIEELLMH